MKKQFRLILLAGGFAFFLMKMTFFCVFVKYRKFRSIEYWTPEFWKVSEHRYRILALKYRRIEYRIQKKVSGAQLWSLNVWLDIETDHGNGFLKPFSAGSMTPKKRFQRVQWPRGNRFNGVIYSTESRLLSIISTNTKPYAKRLQAMNQGLRWWVDWLKNPRVENLALLSL
jgi:hypothetical protein